MGDQIHKGASGQKQQMTFDNDRIIELIKGALNRRETLKEKFLAAYKEKNGRDFDEPVHHSRLVFQ